MNQADRGRDCASLFKAQESALVAGILVVLAVIYVLDRDRRVLPELQSSDAVAHGRPLRRAGRRRGGGDHRRRNRPLDRGRRLARVGRQCQAADRVAARFVVGRRRRPGLIALAIGLTLLMGTSIGLGHALMINLLRLPPFIATLATMAGLRSLATVLCQNRTITVPFPAYRALGKEPWITLSIFACVAVVHEHPDGLHRAGQASLRPGRQ